MEGINRRLRWLMDELLEENRGRVDPRIHDSLMKARKELNFSVALLATMERKKPEMLVLVPA